MNVIGLSGKSGTGKSYVATELCKKLGIDAIIDDGLLIAEGKILAGESAKKQSTRIGAVRTAVFQKEENAREVMLAIERLRPAQIMILGTTDEMIGLIA